MRKHANKQRTLKKTQSFVKKENVVIHTHGHTIIIYCYLQR